MQEAKKLLRTELKRSCETAEKKSIESGDYCEDIIGCIERLPRFAAAGTVALYHSLPDEVSTTLMLERWAGIKRLALPAIENDRMVFREYTCDEGLRKGTFGIGEPHGGAIVQPPEIDLMIVPGMAFDVSGGRLGRGAGFYDRYLSQPAAAHIYKVGLCLPSRLVAKVPIEAHDVAMDEVITI